jgi:3-oxoacyl-[acyl-carrier protein] reductase
LATSPEGQRRVALVTGGGTGIGAASALALARAGCHVAVNYSASADAAEAVAAQCQGLGVKAFAIKADVARDSDCKTLVAETVARFDRLDVLVNNAGITKVVPGKPLEGLAEDDVDRLFQVNVRGVFQMARAAAEPLRAAEGAIVNVSSQSAFSGYGSSMMYAATKGAINTLTLGLARKLAPEIRVNAVCPGFVASDWMKKARGLDDVEVAAFTEATRQATPLKRVVTPADVAESVVFLALAARAITGALLDIDGGAHLAVADPLRYMGKAKG